MPAGVDVLTEPASSAAARLRPAAWLSPWVFGLLATELFVVCGALGAYSVFRVSSPDIHRAGARHLHWAWGTAQLTLVLLGAASAIYLPVVLGRRQRAAAMTLAGVGIMLGLAVCGVKGMEWIAGGGPSIVVVLPPPSVARTAGLAVAGAGRAHPADPAGGARAFAATCAACHGPQADGLAQVGPSLVTSAWVAKTDDASLTRFIAAGRAANDPANQTGKVMPARGGNPFLTDGDLANIVAFLRSLKGGGTGGATTAPASADAAALSVPRWVVPLPAAASTKLAPPPAPAFDPASLPAPLAAGIPTTAEHALAPWVLVLSGLHGFHVLVGLGLLAAALWRAYGQRLDGAASAAANLARFYWVAAVVLWLILWPPLYLW